MVNNSFKQPIDDMMVLAMMSIPCFRLVSRPQTVTTLIWGIWGTSRGPEWCFLRPMKANLQPGDLCQKQQQLCSKQSRNGVLQVKFKVDRLQSTKMGTSLASKAARLDVVRKETYTSNARQGCLLLFEILSCILQPVTYYGLRRTLTVFTCHASLGFPDLCSKNRISIQLRGLSQISLEYTHPPFKDLANNQSGPIMGQTCLYAYSQAKISPLSHLSQATLCRHCCCLLVTCHFLCSIHLGLQIFTSGLRLFKEMPWWPCGFCIWKWQISIYRICINFDANTKLV